MKSDPIIFLEANSSNAPEWIRLLPMGEIPLGDDREPFMVDHAVLDSIVQRFQERGLDLVIDYEHQTLSGQKAPAAGWIKGLEAREDGLWARVEWTAAARQHLESKEYRYFSPVLRLDQESRRPLALLHVALTNTPAINHLPPLVAKSWGPGLGVKGQQVGELSEEAEAWRCDQPGVNWRDKTSGVEISFQPAKEEEAKMEPLLEQLKTKLGLKEEATLEEVLTRANQKLTTIPVLNEVVSILDLPENATVPQIKGAVLALKGGAEQCSRLEQELTAMQSRLAEQEIQEVVMEALQAGKIQPSQLQSALKYARSDLEGFRTFVDKSLQVLPLEKLPELRNDSEAVASHLSSQKMVICEAMGIAPEAFKAQEKLLRTQSLL